MNLKDILKSGECTVVDVRTPVEYMGGHVEGSVNIPLQELPVRVDEFHSMRHPILLCCASGNRSGQAEMYLRSKGMEEVYNAGSWLDVNFFVQG